MDFVSQILFPATPLDTTGSWLMLALRVIFGLMMMTNGIIKIAGYRNLVGSFPDPIHIGSRTSLLLAIFAEALCSLAVLTGLLFRLALLPQIVTMCVAYFVVLGKAPFAQRQLPLSYLLVMLLMLVAGPGRFSLDYLSLCGVN